MAKSLDIPFGNEVIPLTVDDAVKWEDLEPLFSDDDEETGRTVSLCVRRKGGHESSGGYFFHMIWTEEGTVRFKTFDNNDAWESSSLQDAVAFINHVSGLEFSFEMWKISQKVNMREDEYME